MDYHELISLCIMVSDTLCIKAGIMIGNGEPVRDAVTCARCFAQTKVRGNLSKNDLELINGILDSAERFIISLEG